MCSIDDRKSTYRVVPTTPRVPLFFAAFSYQFSPLVYINCILHLISGSQLQSRYCTIIVVVFLEYFCWDLHMYDTACIVCLKTLLQLLYVLCPIRRYANRPYLIEPRTKNVGQQPSLCVPDGVRPRPCLGVTTCLYARRKWTNGGIFMCTPDPFQTYGQ